MLTITLRVKSTGAARRGGVSLLPLGQWHQTHVTRDLEGAQTLLSFLSDAKVTVEVGEPKAEETTNWLENFTWHEAPSIEDVRAMIEHFQAEAAEKDEISDEEAAELLKGFAERANTQLPSVEPTLERDASEIDPQAKTTSNASDLGEAAEELTPPPPPVVSDIPPSTPTTVLNGDPEPATVTVQEAAVPAKTETKPNAKATPKPRR
ncbi:hypothetical protein MMA231_00970 [Asticcacaulis sp. MM231]|uniref:hypothetical protein n=1 Tax=Asticcacaulis sp. MM231 TaxID=3157666 RepID=UPI0032D58479